MNLLPAMILYLTVGCGEWYLALRRTLACARGEKAVLVCIVFIENLLGLWVLSNFIRTNNWLLALSYAAGGSAGALIVAMNGPEKSATTARPPHAPPQRRTKPRRRPFTPAVLERAIQSRGNRRRLLRRRDPQYVEYPDSG